MDVAGNEKKGHFYVFYILNNVSYVILLPLSMGKNMREALIGLILYIVLAGIGKYILLQVN